MAKRDDIGRFPLSHRRVMITGFDYTKDNPLAHLFPNEAICAELFVLCEQDPRTARTMPSGKLNTYSVMRSGNYLARFKDTFGIDMMPHVRKALERNAAWRGYLLKLRTQTREALMDSLKASGLAVMKDYQWAREEAKRQGDYKETRVAAGDHLDRIGASEKKPENIVQNLVVVLKGMSTEALNQETAELVVEPVTIEAP